MLWKSSAQQKLIHLQNLYIYTYKHCYKTSETPRNFLQSLLEKLKEAQTREYLQKIP
jgi:hypothetical protein